MDDGSIYSWVKACTFLVYEEYDKRFYLDGKLPHWTEKFIMFAKSIEKSAPPGVKKAGFIESGQWWFFSNVAMSFEEKDRVPRVSEVRHGGYKFERLVSFVRRGHRICQMPKRSLEHCRNTCCNR